MVPGEPFRVYYQDSSKYLFHYDFAKARFSAFRDLSPEAFDAVSLHTNGQQAVLGAVLLPRMPPVAERDPACPPEYAIQFVGLDPYAPDQICRWFDVVRSTIIASADVKALYFPAFEQSAAAVAHKDYFATNGITVGSPERWSTGNQAYSTGWALGRLKFVPASQIAADYAAGLLLTEDVLLTDAVPAEMPLLAGILTLEPATPNSHVAILANSCGIPFAYLGRTNDVTRARELAGREVLLQVSRNGAFGQVQLLDMEGALDASTRGQILGLKTPLPVQLRPKERFGAYSVWTDNLVPEDSRFFGGKAANYGFLRRAVASNCLPAIAFSLDLWDDFMSQPLAGGRTLQAEIASRLSAYRKYPPDIPALEAELAAIRDLITGTASFTAAQQQAITGALSHFDPLRNLRFRSSSNAEDNQIFTAAGLYDSFSGCLADDLDGDTNGPCCCDLTESKERGVFRAIRKVYASFYNGNAFLERLRYGIDETQIGMALLVHHSAPDSEEVANGVATLQAYHKVSGTRKWWEISGDLVNQVGAVSVTNPRTEAQPERIYVTDYGGGPNFEVQGRSSLVPLGGSVLNWEQDYRELMRLLSAVIARYGEHFPQKESFLLDFEYKKIQPGWLQIKQVRELPLMPTDEVRPFLLGGAFAYRIVQGEGANVLTRHGLKCQLNLNARTVQLDDAMLKNGFYTNATFEFLDGARVEALTNGFACWPNAVHSMTNYGGSALQVYESWTYGVGTNQRAYTFTAVVPRTRPRASPFILDREISKSVTVTDSPSNTGEWVWLAQWRPRAGSILVTNYALLDCGTGGPDGKTIEVADYVYSVPPQWDGGSFDDIIYITYPLAFFDEIRITGLIPEPIVLCSYYAQSATPAHHNWGAWYIFEPRLDPGVPQRQIDLLTAANIRLLHITCPSPWGGAADRQILGLDGTFRPW